MRKSPLHKRNDPLEKPESLEEIIEEHRRLSFLLYKNKEKPVNIGTGLERLRLLTKYAEIGSFLGADAALKEYESAIDWYQNVGFPFRSYKDYTKGDQTAALEVATPIVVTAESLKMLLVLFKMLKQQNTGFLSKLVVEVLETREPVESEIVEATSEQGQRSKQAREENKRIHEILIQKKRSAKYGTTMDNKSVTHLQKPLLKGRKLSFKSVDSAWFADYKTLAAIQIEPYFIEHACELNVLEMAEEQLVKAANIMLKGIQPEIDIVDKGKLVFKYAAWCDWHLIVSGTT